MSTLNKRYSRGIWWVKRDFRLSDNDALLAAIEQCEQLIALFIIEPELCGAPETSLFHYHAWNQAAEHLSSEMQARGGKLHVVYGSALTVFQTFHEKEGFDALFSHEETGSNVT